MKWNDYEMKHEMKWFSSLCIVKVRVGNTDAEGRMAMADCLCEAKEQALKEVNPQIYTIATLTGHAVLAMGQGYTVSRLRCLCNLFWFRMSVGSF